MNSCLTNDNYGIATVIPTFRPAGRRLISIVAGPTIRLLRRQIRVNFSNFVRNSDNEIAHTKGINKIIKYEKYALLEKKSPPTSYHRPAV
jgi:hypothetical protein